MKRKARYLYRAFLVVTGAIRCVLKHGQRYHIFP